MITLKNGQPMRFLIYKTHLPFIGAEHNIILRNSFTEDEQELTFNLVELFNAFKVELSDRDLSAMAGQNLLFVKDASGDKIYSESAFIFADDLHQ